MKSMKKNSKVVIAFILGLILSGTTVYATILLNSTEVSFDNTNANLTKQNGDPVETVQEAVEAINRKVPAACTNSPFKIGDYIDMTPTSDSYTVDQNLRSDDGSATAVTLDPSELNVWRVIKVNSDCTVEVVSEYVSTQSVQFKGKNGYLNYVYVLNEIAKQYAAYPTYTLDPSTAPDGAFRNVGYDGQTKQITDLTRIDDTTLGTASGAWYQKITPLNGEESKGGGDQGYTTDLKLIDDAGLSIVAYKKGTTTPTIYWLASRLFYWDGISYWSFNARYVNNYGYINAYNLWYRGGSSFSAGSINYAVRPIVTLKSGLTKPPGDGTSSSHYQLL